MCLNVSCGSVVLSTQLANPLIYIHLIPLHGLRQTFNSIVQKTNPSKTKLVKIPRMYPSPQRQQTCKQLFVLLFSCGPQMGRQGPPLNLRGESWQSIFGDTNFRLFSRGTFYDPYTSGVGCIPLTSSLSLPAHHTNPHLTMSRSPKNQIAERTKHGKHKCSSIDIS